MKVYSRLFSALWLLAAGGGAAQAAEDRPNIILIMADDIAYDNNFGAYGSDDSWTPRLDRMANEGVKFLNAHSTPKCTPSRVKIMTGRCGIRNYFRFGALDHREITFGAMMQKAGYKTMAAGKWQLDGPEGTETKDAGFDSWLLWNTRVAGGARYWNPKLEQNGKLLDVDEDAYGPDLCVKAITDFIAANKERPFFIYYPMLLVHSPFLPTPDSATRNEKDDKTNFQDMARYMDKNVGRILDCLQASGLDEKTVVLFTTDNGTHRGMQYRSFGRGRPVNGKKGVPHDRGTHAPLIVRAPSKIAPGQVCSDIVDFSDFLPTLAEISGATLPNVVLDGRSFWPQCQGETGNPRAFIFQYYWPKGYGWIPDELGEKELIWVQNAHYKLHGNGLFYDVSKDREEEHPIAERARTPEQRAVAGRLRAAIAAMPKTNKAYDGMPVRSGR